MIHLMQWVQPSIGLMGDLLTFWGGARLAYDAVRAEEDFNRKKADIAFLKDMATDRPAELGGTKVDTSDAQQISESVQWLYAHNFSLSARRGMWKLALGFLLLLVARSLEIIGRISS